MSKTVYRLEIIREFECPKDALKAAKNAKRRGYTRVTLQEEQRTDSGQPINRHAIWPNAQRSKINA